MTNQKVFRVVLIEQQGFHVDVIAQDPTEAMAKVRARLLDPNDDISPIEDYRFNAGYQVEDAVEINPDVADLE
jgi:hypothetical protein